MLRTVGHDGVDDGWWEGELQARGKKRKVGWFPANYVKLMGSSARSTPAAEATAQDGSRSATPVSYPAPAQAPSRECTSQSLPATAADN